MEIESLLKLLFGQLGVIGTVCLGVATALGWLHMQERKDHKQTRELMYQHFEKLLTLQISVASVLAELKLLITEDEKHPPERRN